MRSLLRRTANRIESFVSARLTQQWRAHRKFEEHCIGRLLTELNVDCVLDVGANEGQYATMLRDYSGYRGLIISFEPTPATLTQLRENSKNDPLWHVVPVALGNYTGRAKFHSMPSASSGNSFRELRQTEHPEMQEIEVEVRRLSDVLPELQQKFRFTRPFLKMDTQGFDLEVFAGAGDVIQSIVGLQSELSIDPLYAGAPGWLEALSVYQAAGFTLSNFFPNNNEWSPRLREADCVMFRDEALQSQPARP